MNSFQTLQTALTIVLCITVSFLVGRGPETLQPTPGYTFLRSAEQPGSRQELPFESFQQIENRLTRLETQQDAVKADWSATLQHLEKLRQAVSALSVDVEFIAKSVNTLDITALKQKLETLQAVHGELAKKIEQQPMAASTESSTAGTPEKAQQAQLERQANSHFSQVEARFHEHMSLKRYNDARWVMRFPESLRNTHAGRKAEALLQQIDLQMNVDYEVLEIDARDRADKGRLLEAIEMLRAVSARFPGRKDLLDRSQIALQKLEEERHRIASDPAVFAGTDSAKIVELIADMAHEDPKKVLDAKQQLRQLGARAEEFLLEALDNPKSEIRWGAVTLLGKLEGERCEDGLILALRDVDIQVRFSALEALERLRSFRALDEVIKLVADKDFDVARRAIATFEQVTGHKVLFDNIEVTPENISGVQEMMTLYWAKNRSAALKP